SAPVQGIAAYKPPQSDAGGDLYIMDFIGMLGIPLVPVSSYPMEAQTIFLPTQAATDPNIVAKVLASHKQGIRIIMTAGFLASVDDQGQLANLAGIIKPEIQAISADRILVDGEEKVLERPLDMEADVIIDDADILLDAISGDFRNPFLTQSKDKQIYVLNSHTFSEADFEAVGEVLLCPRALGLLELPQSWANSLRGVFNEKLNIELNAPTRVTMQPLENGNIVLHNYNQHEIEIHISELEESKWVDLFQNLELIVDSGSTTIKMKPRSRIWLGKGD
ncbi:MAG: hypothetical protein KAI29_21565, partial [Cyclobacteriaceae bacterium]|nr:hypothetical protein [Cyclobacteriaceae bacterium]